MVNATLISAHLLYYNITELSSSLATVYCTCALVCILLHITSLFIDLLLHKLVILKNISNVIMLCNEQGTLNELLDLDIEETPY